MNTGHPPLKNRRIDWLDFARGLAIIMVIVVHTVEKIYTFDLEHMNPIEGPSKIFAFCAFTFGRLGVPLFLFLTGYLLCGRKYESADDIFRFWRHKLIPLIVTFECWTLICELFCVLFYKTEFRLDLCLKRMLFLEPSSMSHMWYMPMIIGLYFTLPLLSYLLHRFPIKVFTLPMLLCFLHYFVIPDLKIVFAIWELSGIEGQMSLEYTGGSYGLYMVCGYILKIVHPRLLAARRKYIRLPLYLLCTVALSFALTVWFQIWCYRNHFRYNVWYTTVSLFFCAVSLFAFISLYAECIPGAHLWSRISVASLGIYFIHKPILSLLLPYALTYFESIKMPFRVIVTVLICFLVSFCIGEILSLIPGVSKILLQRNHKISRKKEA